MKKVRGIRNIVDEACSLDREIKEKNAKFNDLKDKIKRHAKVTKQREIKGNKLGNSATVSDSTVTTIPLKPVWNELGKNIDKLELVVNVVASKLAPYMKAEKIEKIKNTETVDYNICNLNYKK